MTLSKFIKSLKKLEAKGHGNKDVVYAADSEGNSYHKVEYDCGLGKFDEFNREFTTEDDEGKKLKKDKYNAVCIN